MSLGERVALAKERLSIPELWERLGLPDPPARFGINVKSPFRDDGKTGSFNISSCGTFFKDYGAGGHGHQGDGVNFILLYAGLEANAKGEERRKAMEQFCMLAGVDTGGGDTEELKQARQKTAARAPKLRELPELPDNLEEGGDAWRDMLAETRGLGRAGIDLAVERGFLRFAPNIHLELNEGRSYDCASPVWVIRDPSGANAQVRRLDGAPWWGRLKAITIKGSWAGWPIGLEQLQEREDILLCEGGPDFLAGFHLLAERHTLLEPVAMLGAGQPIPEAALPLFQYRNVVIAAHHDYEKELPDGSRQRAGEVAIWKWAEQLWDYTQKIYRVQGFQEGQDLNDWVAAGGQQVKARPVRRAV